MDQGKIQMYALQHLAWLGPPLIGPSKALLRRHQLLDLFHVLTGPLTDDCE
jgi:hypothetical protein